jgi:hypothetical protein
VNELTVITEEDASQKSAIQTWQRKKSLFTRSEYLPWGIALPDGRLRERIGPAEIALIRQTRSNTHTKDRAI